MDDSEIKKENLLLLVKLIAMVILIEGVIDIVFFVISGSFSWFDILINVPFVVLFIPIMYNWYKVIRTSIPEYKFLRYLQISGIQASEDDGKIDVSLKGFKGLFVKRFVYDKTKNEFYGSKYISSAISSNSRS